MIVPTLQQILNQKQQLSQLSEQPSFTLTDILEERYDEDLIEDVDIDNMDDLFEDQPNQETEESPVYQYKNQNNDFTQINDNNINTRNIHQNQSPLVKNHTNSRLGSSSLYTSRIETQAPRHERIKNMPIVPLQEINNMSFVVLKNVTNLFEDVRNIHIGIPTAISATGNRFLAVGTSMGNIAIFQIGVRGYKILGTSQQRKYGYVSSLSISRDNKFLVTGNQSGVVAVWDLYTFSLVKQYINNKAKIMQVQFCSQTYENFISSDVEGNTYIYTIQKYIFTNLKSQKLLDNIGALFHDIRFHQLQTGNSLLSLCSLQFVLLISTKPQIRVIGKIKRPNGIPSSYIPNAQMGRCFIESFSFKQEAKPSYDILLVSWGSNLYIYRFIPAASGFQQIQQLLIYNNEASIYNIEYLSQNIFVTLDKHQIFRTIRINFNLPKSFFNNDESIRDRKTPEISCEIINRKQMQEEIIYQRFMKNKQNKFIKSFINTIINCSFSTSEHKQIFFIAKNSVYRSRLHKWKDYLSQLINEQKNLKMAMKISIQLRNGKLNIFSQKVENYGKKGEKNINTFCDVGKIFIEQGLKDIKQNNIERVKNVQRSQIDIKQIVEDLKQLYEYTIEYFIEIKCQSYLFNTIYQKIIKNLPSFEYWQLFIESLKPFIINQKLVRIPNIQVFRQILDYFSSNKAKQIGEDNMKLIDKLIINLQPQSLHYQETVTLLTQNRLYTSLSYICSMNKDFISPCNKLLTKILQAFGAKHQNAEKQFYQILKLYLSKLIKGYYINDKKIEKKIYQTHVLRDISVWLSFEDTLEYFMKPKTQQNNESILQKFKVYVEWVYKLIEQTSKLRDKRTFHQLIKHLSQSLQNLQQNEMKDKDEKNKERKIIVYIKSLKFQIALMLQKFSRSISLSSQQINFYVTNIYQSNMNQNSLQNKNYQPFTLVLLEDEFQFFSHYFEELHSIKLQGFQPQGNINYPIQEILLKKNDWVKYLYNFFVINLMKQQNQLQQGDLQQKNGFSNVPLDAEKKLIHPKSQQKILQLGTPQRRSHQIESKNNSSFSRIRLGSFSNLSQLPLSKDIQQQTEQQSRSNNAILAKFIIQNCSFEQIDKNISSLLKLNSQILIVYLLQNYEIQLVNEKIDLISDEQVKYFVVRRILKILRKKQHYFNSSQKEERIVWGNQYRSYAKKQEASKKEKVKKSPSLSNPNARLSKQTMIFYLKCLAKYKRQKRVYTQLKENMDQYQNYIKQILEIVIQFKLNSCIALIYLHMQNYQKALEFYQLVYQERFDINLRKLHLVQYCHGRFLKKIFEQILEICRHINKNEIWMRLLQTVLQPLVQDDKFLRGKKQKVIEKIQRIYQQQSHHAFIQELGSVIQTILLEVSSRISIQNISAILDRYSELLNKTYMLNCLKSTMHTYSKSIFIYEISNSMVVNDQAHQFQKIYTDHKIKGMNSIPICQSCAKLISYNDHIKMYTCGHIYHSQCVDKQQQRCMKCMLIEVGEKREQASSFIEMEQLKKQSQMQSNVSSKLSEPPSTEEQLQNKKRNTIDRCLAFDDFLLRQQEKFEHFRKDYDSYISKYQ